MYMNTMPSKKTVLLLAALLPTTFIVTGEEAKKPVACDTHWVMAGKAGYPLDKEAADTMHAELMAKALPDSRITMLRTRNEWDEFIKRFASVDKGSRKPEFLSYTGLERHPHSVSQEQVGFAPDFDQQAVLVLSAEKSQKEGLSGLLDIEIFEDGGRFRAFAFFGPADSEAVKPGDEPKESEVGRFYMVSIPRKLADQPVEFRMALQTWGRECSTFSPVITSLDATGNQRNIPAEQDSGGQPATRSESK